MNGHLITHPCAVTSCGHCVLMVRAFGVHPSAALRCAVRKPLGSSLLPEGARIWTSTSLPHLVLHADAWQIALLPTCVTACLGEATQSLSFCVWLILPNVMSPRPIACHQCPDSSVRLRTPCVQTHHIFNTCTPTTHAQAAPVSWLL